MTRSASACRAPISLATTRPKHSHSALGIHARLTMQQLTPSEETAGLLARLSNRPGVQGTLILSRDTGAIVRSSGLATEEEDGDGEPVPPGSSHGQPNGTDGEQKRTGTRKAEEVARLVWRFVQSAGDMVGELNGDADEAKLLRVRTKRNELVIVPGMWIHLMLAASANLRVDSKFLLVVLHDTPPA